MQPEYAPLPIPRVIRVSETVHQVLRPTIFRRFMNPRKKKAVPDIEFSPWDVGNLPRTSNSEAGNQIVIPVIHSGPMIPPFPEVPIKSIVLVSENSNGL